MKLLLFGCNGQLGRELQSALSTVGHVIALHRASPDHCGDLTNLDGMATTVADIAPDIIVNAAAFTAVDAAESNRELAFRVNAEAPGILAAQAQKIGAWLIHYSTDYVFDGSGQTPWRETDQTGPLNVYGASKLQGEQAMTQIGGKHLIFRTSWVYGRHGNNFLRTMLRLAQERTELKVIDDQFGAPTGTTLLAQMTAHAIREIEARATRIEPGLYHLAAGGTTSWHAYTHHILKEAQAAGIPLTVTADDVTPIPTSAYPTAAKRPANSRLNTEKFTTTFGVDLPTWEVGVSSVVRALAADSKNA